jgi:hypothetical protein
MSKTPTHHIWNLYVTVDFDDGVDDADDDAVNAGLVQLQHTMTAHSHINSRSRRSSTHIPQSRSLDLRD